MTIQERARQARMEQEQKEAALLDRERGIHASVAVYLAYKYLGIEAAPDYQRGIVRADELIFTAKSYTDASADDYGHALYVGMRCEHGRHSYEGRSCKGIAWIRVDGLVRLASILANEDSDRFFCDMHLHESSLDW